ncbi:hypothetical protein PVK06_040558 [Gossypium arboreum]|uniref:MULE transposase domain-containing protein n=1 Tax=Gossypium arboreum TaxID=29729 RepID=A0ABR0N5T8_GOSAR|nr:hypothetical protein PVK06_040558 [Gossypium arboreum]
MLIYFHELGTIGLQNNLKVIYDDTSTIDTLEFWVKFKEIDLYVEHEVDNPIIIDENFLLTVGEGNDEGVESNGEGDLEMVESSGKGDVEGISLGSTIGEDAGDFATSNGVDNVAVAISGEEEDRNDIEDHPKMKLREIKRRCASKMHINVTIDCCYKEKKIVKEKMVGNHKKEFGLLWDYVHELRSKMPGSSIKMVVQRVTANSIPHFKRYYVCFNALKRGWIAGCRLLIGLDGCFLKGPLKCKFLTTVGRDANNQMFPIAWVVVEVECTDSWAWYGYTIISDQQKGLEIAISDILPRVEHRNCAMHVFANWSGRKLGKSYECDFWQIVKCTTEREWKDLCSALDKKYKDA